MHFGVVTAFVEAAVDVLAQELGEPPQAGEMRTQRSTHATEEVTVLVGVTGHVRGMVLYGMSERTALALASRMLGERRTALDEIVQSGVAELGNVITGIAGQVLETRGITIVISPPALLVGNGVTFSTVDIRRVTVPLVTQAGNLAMHLALEAASPQGGPHRSVAAETSALSPAGYSATAAAESTPAGAGADAPR